jgi:hypothetical protein
MFSGRKSGMLVEIVAGDIHKFPQRCLQVIESIDLQTSGSHHLGAGGRAFKSPRPGQLKRSPLFSIAKSRLAGVFVDVCGPFGLLEAFTYYKIVYSRVDLGADLTACFPKLRLVFVG